MDEKTNPDLYWKTKVLGTQQVTAAMLLFLFKGHDDPREIAREFGNSVSEAIDHLKLELTPDSEREMTREAIREAAFSIIRSATTTGSTRMPTRQPQ